MSGLKMFWHRGVGLRDALCQAWLAEQQSRASRLPEERRYKLTGGSAACLRGGNLGRLAAGWDGALLGALSGGLARRNGADRTPGNLAAGG